MGIAIVYWAGRGHVRKRHRPYPGLADRLLLKHIILEHSIRPLLNLIKRLIKGCARMLGAELVQRNTANYWDRQSQSGVLKQISRLGIKINTVIDVGAAHGEWSLNSEAALRAERYVLLEPLSEYTTFLDRAAKQLPNATVRHVALGIEPGIRTINVHPDLVGSSFYLEDEASDVNGVPREVEVETLDDVCAAENLTGPYLLKLDVQGAEAEVLRGGAKTLEHCEFVIIETSFFDFYNNGITAEHVIALLSDAGFVLYDIFGMSHRPFDGALAQADFCFVKRDGAFRHDHYFATAEQRRALTARLQKTAVTS